MGAAILVRLSADGFAFPKNLRLAIGHESAQFFDIGLILTGRDLWVITLHHLSESVPVIFCELSGTKFSIKRKHTQQFERSPSRPQV